MASVNWMFVEGLVLHIKLARVFRQGHNFAYYHGFAWGEFGFETIKTIGWVRNQLNWFQNRISLSDEQFFEKPSVVFPKLKL